MKAHSLETILNYENRDLDSDWSVVWSTAHIPGMDNARGGGRGGGRRIYGRRRLRYGAFALCALLTMHCRVAASAVTGGFFVFLMALVVAVVLLANPMRHFEVYLGQWSISGPGRAFRIIPMLDGIGLAMCINAIIRAICCCCIAAIAAVYLVHSVSDRTLPYKYCRNFSLKPYQPLLKETTITKRIKNLAKLHAPKHVDSVELVSQDPATTIGIKDRAWRNISHELLPPPSQLKQNVWRKSTSTIKVHMCSETYSGKYPPLYKSPPYNFFYVELVHYRVDMKTFDFNTNLIISVCAMWGIIWGTMLYEKISYGRLVWNNMHPWLLMFPIIWTVTMVVTAAIHLKNMRKIVRRDLRITSKEIVHAIGDALEIALYIHSASSGTEIIHGKGLNHYAMGHIDQHLNAENLWHSALLLVLTGLHTGGAAACALSDYHQPVYNYTMHKMQDSTLWIIPMYSKCTLSGEYSHFSSAMIFSGLMMAYIVVAYCFLKTALHTIFEYRVKLVFIEQIIVGTLILTCTGLSLLFTSSDGLPFLESVDAYSSGLAMPFLCLLELVALLFVYRSNDFISDMNAATEENACSTRIGVQWKIIPVLNAIVLILKIISLIDAEMPTRYLLWAIAPLLAVVVAVPIRACHNAYAFLKPTPRHGV